MPPENDSLAALTAGAQRLVELAAQKQRESGQDQLGAFHWLLALVERHGPMAEALTQGLAAAALQRHLPEQLKKGDLGAPLDTEGAVRAAMARAQARGRPQANERDLAAVILSTAGYPLTEGPGSPPTSAPTESKQPPVPGTGAPPPAVAAPARHAPPRPTPTLEQFGSDLTREARSGKLSPVVGRTDEIQLVIETLCRRTKRNPVLVGPAGVGKTAIVEGLAQRIVSGDVPALLRDTRLISVQPSALVAGASVWGETEKRIKALLAEASQEGILLFIDEVHSIIGTGGREGTGDFASLLKPALARGDLVCIAATTDDEYRRFIEPDAALERRFQPIRVQELNPEQTLAVLASLRDVFARSRGVQVPDEVLAWLVEFAGEYLRNRYFPDKAVDLLEQSVAYALTQGHDAVSEADASSVARRMIGMPLAADERLAALRAILTEDLLLPEEESRLLLDRLEVTVRGLDLRPARPNAVVLLLGEAAAQGEALVEAMGRTLFGAADRVVAIDLSRFVHPEDVSMLIGSARGYVGYGESLPLHRVVQMPWCVVRFDNLHACHPQVLEVITQALASGFFTDSTGKRIYLSDAVVLLTAQTSASGGHGIGFLGAGETPSRSARRAAEAVLGRGLVAQCDLICAEFATSDAARRQWLQKYLLADIAERYRHRGIQLQWDESLLQWMLHQKDSPMNRRDWERLVEETLIPPLVPLLPAAAAGNLQTVRIAFENDRVRIHPVVPGDAAKSDEHP